MKKSTKDGQPSEGNVKKHAWKIIEEYKMNVALLEGELKRRPGNKQHVTVILRNTKLKKEYNKSLSIN